MVVTADPEDQTATRRGDQFQAMLPEARQRPVAPTQEEAAWLGELVMEPHNPDVLQPPLRELADMAAASEAERWVTMVHLIVLGCPFIWWTCCVGIELAA